MFRKTLLASAISLALLPNAAGALGLGGIRTQSALNEPFVGYIELLDVATDELDTVKVLLASEDEFAKIGADRPHFLAKLRFQPRLLTGGRAVIRVNSIEAVREPFLDFLIEVNWPKGRLIKEYTVLLDPPVTLDSPPPRARLARPPASVDTSAFPMRYGPVERGSNLWRIANGMAKATGATVTQAAMALYRTNQHAFVRGDINMLRVGETLQMPTAAELFALDEWSASQEFGAAIRGARVAATPLTDITEEARLEIAGVSDRASRAEAPSPSAQVPTTEAVAQEGQPVAQAPSAQSQGQTGEAAVPGGVEPGLGAIQEDLLLVQEAGESTRQETQELRSRIHELEGRLVDVQRLLEISDERFAALQQAESGQPEGLGAEAMDVPPPEAEALPVPEETASPQTEVTPTPEEAVPATASQPGPENAVEPEPLSAGQAPGSEPTFWESIGKPQWMLGLASVVLLLFLGWMIGRRRKQSASGEPDEYPTAAAAAVAGFSAEEPVAAQEPSGAAAEPQEPSTSYSEVTNWGDETEEGDILSEADVYIAYGRYRDAEALLEEGIKRWPDRIDLKYKLADANFGAGNLKGLEALMESMQLAGEDRINLDQWQRLDGMLAELKGTDADGPRPSASSGAERGSFSAGVEPASTSPSPFGAGATLDLHSQAPMPSSGDAPSAEGLRADTQDLGAGDLELDLGGMEVLGGEFASQTSGDSVELPDTASELELQLKELSDQKEADRSDISRSVPALEPLSTDAFSTLSSDSQPDSIDLPPLSMDSLEAGLASSQLRKDSGVWDEAATKIDLARAYIEMEDPEAARAILEEVAQEGNESQRAQAKEMMEQMD